MTKTTMKARVTANTSSPNTPPGPHGHPLAGSALDYQRDPVGFLQTISREYGDVVRYRMGWLSFYLINHPDHIKHVMVDNNRNYGTLQADSMLAKVFGKSLVMSYGEFWRRQRRLVQPAFHRERIKAAGTLMTDETIELLEEWQTLAKCDQPLDMLEEMKSLTLRIAVKALFGVGIGNEATAIIQAVTTILDYFAYRIKKMPFPPPLIVPTSQNRRFQAALHTLEEVVYNMINERRLRKEDMGDLLSMLILARDEETGRGMDDRQLRDEILAMIFMAHESTANTLAWTWYLLSQHPTVERRLHAELEEVLGGRTPTVEDLPNLPYTRMVYEESMRLYPPGWLLGHRALMDDAIGGYHIPAKAGVVFSPYIMHRHPTFWKNAEEFDPERFTPAQSATRPHYVYFPFGLGPRMCVGRPLAMTESQLILATVAQHLQLQLVPGHPVEPDFQTTLHPRYGIVMTLHPR